MNKIDKTIYENLNLLPLDLQGWNGNSKFFGELITNIKPTTIIEVGSWKGQSAVNMGKKVKELNLNTQIYCVDTWLGAIEFWTNLGSSNERNLQLLNGYPQVYYQFLSNVVHSELQDVILPFPNTSENGYRYFSHYGITSEMIYIDASHEVDDVYRDITNYFKLLKPNGVIFGDDYVDWVGVRDAVNQFVSENNLNLEVIENNFWVIRK